MDHRMISIIKQLSDTSYITSKVLALKCGCSVKTIKNTINENRDNLQEYGINLISSIGAGYKLEITDFEKFQRVCYSNHESTDNIKKLLLELLSEDDYISIETLAERLYVDRMTVDRLMPMLSEQAKDYGLQVLTKPHKGIKLHGTEKAFRICYAHCSLEMDSSDDRNDLLGIQSILNYILEDENFEISDVALNNLTFHLRVAIDRIRQNNVIEEESDTYKIAEEREYRIAKRIGKEIEEMYHISMPESEIIYIAMHLYGKKVIGNCQHVDIKILQMIDEILEAIYQEKSVDLRGNLELKTFMALHLQPMLARVKFDLQQSNPMLVNIKREMNEAFEYALIAKKVIEDHGNKSITEDETAFLALHLALALEKKKNKSFKKIILVCTSGMGTSRLLQHRIKMKYGMETKDVELASIFQLKNKNFEEYACILSTVPLLESYPIPVILVDPSYGEDISTERIGMLLSQVPEETESVIKESLIFPGMKLKSREEVLHFLCVRITEQYDLAENFEEEVRKRESLSSTEIGNQIAFPHPLNYDGEIAFAVMFLEKPILWHRMKVKYIFLLALPKRETEFSRYVSEKITSALCDEEKIIRMEEEPTAANIRKLFFD
jgi:lichenan operon transcriptional antiterminator